MARFNEIVDVLSKLLLPVVVAVIGLAYNIIQDQNNKQQLALDRTTTLLKQLASDKPAERKGAVIVMNYLVQQGQIPPDLATSPLLVAVEDSNQQVAALAKAAFSNIAREDEVFKSTLQQAAKTDTSIQEILDAAFIETPENDFITCADIDSLKQPVGISNKFDTGGVYVWARVQSPRKKERLRFQWVDLETGDIIREKAHVVQKSLGRGWRTWDRKNVLPGRFEVRLVNSLNEQIARREFFVAAPDSSRKPKKALTKKN